MTTGCVTGRFQPVHDQHLELIGVALAECDHVIVAVTNPDTEARHEESTSAHRHTRAANPFTYYERSRLLTAALAGAGWADRTTIAPFDLTRPTVWADYVPLDARQYVRAYHGWERQKAEALVAGGYPVTVLDGDPAAKRSATEVRVLLAADAGWHDAVPPGVAPLLAEILAVAPMAARR
ncbi:adenylyltransferase/cytidyltransferase family protein [Pseudonocardia abyssalis]|uniref:Adenylyltransferase/cytidyltransferase family protein n=1 Tax=Pseudonocardia abyssalis TaxID=2792008 RepID=A0ABS6V229_9PSEU|nr:adenylyltransferase/cytidyltransferase family protein [Pseudonocardia abyssalis]MBW0114168.1 adenylyltransferase/cytidyltransferase family protein [Pseudonocardia abyssalis]MBW0138561.1 adenylyltransferase/cytidyltransferase family protein [Pseudonocardia abyssalis]